jgi:hypothetical protein
MTLEDTIKSMGTQLPITVEDRLPEQKRKILENLP